MTPKFHDLDTQLNPPVIVKIQILQNIYAQNTQKCGRYALKNNQEKACQYVGKD